MRLVLGSRKKEGKGPFDKTLFEGIATQQQEL